MSIRAKCAILLVAFEITLAASIIVTVRYVGGYFEDAAGSFRVSRNRVLDISRTRTLVRDEMMQLLQFAPHDDAVDDARELGRRVNRSAEVVQAGFDEPLADARRQPFPELRRAREDAVRGFLAGARNAGGRVGPAFDPAAHRALDAFLVKEEYLTWEDVQQSVSSSVAAQEKALLILSLNMLVGAGLGILGLVLVRRWVLLPVQELKSVTDELGKGNLEHRARVTSGDELGQLAQAFNRMSADLARIEKQMIQRERLAAVGEMVSYVAHNIRNPLADIRSSAELTRQETTDTSQIAAHQAGIIDAVDRFQRWLRQIEHTWSPLEIRPEPTNIEDLIDNVIAVFRPVARRRDITIHQPPTDGDKIVNIDSGQFEQALVAVIGNAVEAAPDGGTVTIRTESNGDASRWCLSVADNGPGIAPDVRDRIFQPAFTTKPTGQGLGLAMARKIVEWHGGEITCESPPDGETVFRLTMPVSPEGRVADA